MKQDVQQTYKSNDTEEWLDRVLTPEGTPGYFTLGRLFANGYLKALLQGTGNVLSAKKLE